MKSKTIDELRTEFEKSFGKEEECYSLDGKQDSHRWYSHFEGWLSAYSQYYEPLLEAHTSVVHHLAKAIKRNKEWVALMDEVRPVVGEGVLHRPLHEVVEILDRIDALMGDYNETRMDPETTQDRRNQCCESKSRVSVEA